MSIRDEIMGIHNQGRALEIIPTPGTEHDPVPNPNPSPLPAPGPTPVPEPEPEP